MYLSKLELHIYMHKEEESYNYKTHIWTISPKLFVCLNTIHDDQP